jgi:predicted TIM-barrel enzyme
VFTVAYAFTPEEAAAMADAGADVIGAHVGLTVGGFIGAKQAAALDDACDRVAAMTEAARRARPDVWVVAHGGPFDEPENVQTVYDRVDVDGFLGASSIERLPVERAIQETVQAFRGLRLRNS